MKWQIEFREILSNELVKRKAKNSSYSMRSFAKQLGIGSGALSEILSGARAWNFSPEWALKVMQNITLDKSQKNRIMALMGFAPEELTETIDANKENEQFFKDWTVFPILMSFDLPCELSTSASIAGRLNLSKDKVESVIQGLIEKGLLIAQTEPDGTIKFQRKQIVLTSKEHSEPEIIKDFHSHSLALAQKILTESAVKDLTFQTVTMVGSPEGIENLKAEIEQLILRASSLVDYGDKNTQVYRLAVQLFPFNFKS